MGEINCDYASEICARLFNELSENTKNYTLAKIGIGELTFSEAKTNNYHLIKRIELFFENMGWDSGLVKKLINLN